MRVPRSGHTASLLPSGMVLIAGGTSSASAELFDPARGTFTPTGNMTTARVHHTATLLSNGQVLLAGGWSLNLPVASAEVFNPATGSFTATGPMTRGRVYHSAVRLPNGQVLIAGGGNNSPNLLAMTSAELFNPSTGTFTATGPMTTPRFYHTATVLPNGQVLLAGGKDNIPYDRPPAVAAVAGTERFNPPTGTFTTAGDLAVPRFLHTATLLLNGQVLITGGESSGFVLAGTELVGP